MNQKKVYPIHCAREEYNKVIKLLDEIGCDYSETEWLTVYSVAARQNIEVIVIAAVLDDSEILKVMKEMKYNFV